MGHIQFNSLEGCWNFGGLNLHTLPNWAALFWDVCEVKSADIPFEEDIKLVPSVAVGSGWWDVCQMLATPGLKSTES